MATRVTACPVCHGPLSLIAETLFPAMFAMPPVEPVNVFRCQQCGRHHFIQQRPTATKESALENIRRRRKEGG